MKTNKILLTLLSILTLSGCTFNNPNKSCNHIDENPKDHICDICGEELSICKDDDKNHECEYCGKVISQHADLDLDHKCDVCGFIMSNHSDDNHDHKCDMCGVAISQCKDENKDHKCDVCGTKLSDCEDKNKDHECDICGEKISECLDENPKDHLCDICGNKLSNCEDKDNDDLCDICGTHLEFKCYIAYKSRNFAIESGNALTKDYVDTNIFYKIKTFHKGDVIKIINVNTTFSNFDPLDSDTKNAFKNSLIKQTTSETIEFKTKGEYRITLDHADSNKITIEFTTIEGYQTIESRGQYTEKGSLVFEQNDSNPTSLTFKKTNQVFDKGEWIQIKDSEGELRHYSFTTTYASYFEFNEMENYSTVRFTKDSRIDVFDMILKVDVETGNLALDISWVKYNK